MKKLFVAMLVAAFATANMGAAIAADNKVQAGAPLKDANGNVVKDQSGTPVTTPVGQDLSPAVWKEFYFGAG